MTDKNNTSQKNKSYETAIDELEGILTQLESNDLPLEEAIKQFESGVALIKHCQGILDTTEQKIKFLTGDGETDDTQASAENSADDVPF